MEKYLDYYISYLNIMYSSQNTRKQYGIDAKQFVKFIEENNLSVKDDIRTMMKGYKNELLQTYKSLASVNRKLSSLKVFLSFLKDRDVILIVPEDILQPIIMEKSKLNTLTNEEMRKVLNACFTTYQTTIEQPYKWIALRNLCIVLVIAELGIKPSEVVRMKWSHFGEGEVNIIKPSSFRTMDVSKSLINWLQLLKEETKEINDIENDYIWLGIGNKKNEPITVKTIERIFQFISKQVGFYVTATMVRYYVIDNETASQQDERLNELYKQFGYVRKSVLTERIQRF